MCQTSPIFPQPLININYTIPTWNRAMPRQWQQCAPMRIAHRAAFVANQPIARRATTPAETFVCQNEGEIVLFHILIQNSAKQCINAVEFKSNWSSQTQSWTGIAPDPRMGTRIRSQCLLCTVVAGHVFSMNMHVLTTFSSCFWCDQLSRLGVDVGKQFFKELSH